MGELIKNQKGLERLNLNLRSWAYNNEKITDEGLSDFFDGLSNCTTIKFLQLGLRGFAYNNNNSVTSKSIEYLIDKLPNLQDLEEFVMNVEVWYNSGCDEYEPIWQQLNKCLNKMPRLNKREIIH